MKKIGIYGGSFNPIHNGHIEISKLVKKELNLDELLIIPVGNPSHRINDLVEAELRYEMCVKAFEKEKGITVLDIEIKEEKISYTYDTLLKIIEAYGEAQYFEIIGEDSGENFYKWKNFKEILKLSKVVVLKRKGYETNIEDENLIFLENEYLDYSSTKIRERIQKNECIENLVSKEVEEIIRKNKLYKK